MNKLRTIIQNQARQLFVASMLVAVLLAPILSSGSSKAAGSDVLSLSPSSGSYDVGSTFTVSLYATTPSGSGHNIAAADADLLFNPAQLQYVSSSTAGSAFSQFYGPTVTSNEFVLAGSSGGAGFAGTSLIGSVTFKTLAGSGTAAITFGSQASILDPAGDSTWNGSTAAASYSLTTPVVTPPPPPPPPPPSGGGSTAPAGGSSSPTSGSPSHTATTASVSATHGSTPLAVPPTASATSSNPAPVISGVSVSGITTTSATVSWQTNIAATSVVNYGLNSKYGLTTQNSAMTTTHQVTLSAPNLSSATSYQFVVESVSAGGVGATSAAQTFRTLGFPITIRVVDAYGKVVKGALVIVDGQSQTTNNLGIAIFQNMPAGSLRVTIKIGNASTIRTITVSGTIATSGTTPLQQFSLSAVRGSTNPVYYLIAIIVIVFMAAGAILRPRSHLLHFPGGSADMAVPGAGDPDLNISVIKPLTATPQPTVEPAPESSPGPVTLSNLHPEFHVHQPGQVITPDAQKPPDDNEPPA